MRRIAVLCAAHLLLAAAAAAAPVAITNPGFEDLYLGSNLPVSYGGVVPPGAFPVGPAPAGWTAWYSTGSAPPGAFVGVLNPGRVVDDGPIATFFPDGAPEGDNAVLLYHDDPAGGPAYGVHQVLAATLEPDTTYTLTVEVGNIASGIGFVDPWASLGYYDLEGFPGYRVQLRAGPAILAQDDDALLPGEGEFATSTVVYTSGDDHEELGSNLEIWLISLNQATAVAGQRGVEVDFDDVRLDASPAPIPVPVGRGAFRGVLVALLALGIATTRATAKGS